MLHWPVTALGFGRRAGIWFQGCSIECPGCCARDTWRQDDERLTSLEGLLEWFDARNSEGLDGVTITGGEPFDQPAALTSLLRHLNRRRSNGNPFDILVYSGYQRKRVIEIMGGSLVGMDALISAPYVHTRPSAPLRGSDNQEITGVTELGVRRYGNLAKRQSTLQISVAHDELTLLGIPERGDLLLLEKKLEQKGIEFGKTSWRA